MEVALTGLVILAAALTYAPTLRNGFLTLAFDDAIILDTAAIHERSLRAMATEFVHAHYVPLTLLSLSLDHALWKLEPRGYHATNVLLHALTGALVFWFARRIAPSLLAAAAAALLFTVHPLQMEAVSLAIQRKTLLSGALFFVAFLFYQRWTEGRRRADYAGALLAFAAAGLAKPIVVCLPALLVLYDVCFVDGRLRLRDKVPFALLAALVAAAAAGAHAAVGAVHPPHGGDALSHVLIVARALAESTVTVFVPMGLSPIYYYPPGSARTVPNALALLALGGGCLFLLLRRRRFPWSFFCFAWYALALLPESNVFPLAQLRADRFLYLPLFGPALWIATAIDRLPALAGSAWSRRLPALAAAATLVVAFGALCRASAGVWKDDVSAWRRVAERHPWSATARTQLGVAYATRGEAEAAEKRFLEAIRLRPEMAEPHFQLAHLYHDHGAGRRAAEEAQRFLELAPDDPRAAALKKKLDNGAAR
jgi:tetratricopeptide (TPR) repeat protein